MAAGMGECDRQCLPAGLPFAAMRSALLLLWRSLTGEYPILRTIPSKPEARLGIRALPVPGWPGDL